ncbi:MAG TPA: peptidoglycan DD-metalloendopeptidase family protein [Nocardioidaceae bacterium]|nr:peptidoglycan DD-metalloendopeptidase family protein [Nocardioidaceae bacterium]
MVRSFPRATRRRLVAAVVAGTCLLGFAAVPPALSDDLKDRKNKVDRDIRSSQKHLDQSSAALLRATQALETAEERLVAAEAHLARTRGELAAAEVLDRRMQIELTEAIARLARAREDLREGRRDIGDQEEIMRQVAVQQFQTGTPGLMGVGMVLNSEDPVELTSQLNSMQNVMDKESATLDRLKASRVLLKVTEREVAEAKVDVAQKRAAAAENLERKQQIEEAAAEAEAAVTVMVAEREKARGAAAKAKAEDLAQLRNLKAERAKIADLIEKRAAAAARAAARRAAKARKEVKTATSGSLLGYPVNSYITSSYGMRLHPVYKRWTLHDGTDFGASCGTPIRAAADGQVIAKYYNTGYGNRVIIYHGYKKGGSLATSYNHLSGYSTYTGQRVERGEIIGFVGTTGYSTGCHLHFMVFRNGATVNPMNWL